MKKFILMLSLSVTCCACDHLEATQTAFTDQERVVPKSYSPPTVTSIVDEAGWRYQGTIQPGGDTQIGHTDALIAYDAFLSAGSSLRLHGWSAGWASLHVFGHQRTSDDWVEVAQTIMSNPVDANVEMGRTDFVVPFDGQYLVLMGPVDRESFDYLLRLECIDGCP